MGVLFDAGCRDLDHGRFWKPGSYFTHPARAKALVLVFLPPYELDRVVLGRRAAGLLETRKGLALDWAGKDRRSAVWMIVKTMASDLKTGRNRELRLSPDDLAALRSLAPGRKATGQRRLRGWAVGVPAPVLKT